MRDISWAHKKIFVFLLLLLVINCVNAALTAYICVGNSELRRQVLQDYFRCEARGSHAECNEVANVQQTSSNLLSVALIAAALFPPILLPFIVNVKELKKSCKHIYRVCSEPPDIFM